ncbi:hypothetical protein FHP25_29745 [Vineibacter terrae]|uniref:Uncharacterized protein n=1 Tax=Vineibacter terrae TaxID=2586908 RepID=A0A5C8PEI6_9HYPH|nr:hypothetical protein FHP25_29745 [Vineibacter terrae]
MAKRTSSRPIRQARSDGRKSLLVYLRPDVIRRLKVAALDQNRPAYEITEEAVSAWLSARDRRAGRKE